MNTVIIVTNTGRTTVSVENGTTLGAALQQANIPADGMQITLGGAAATAATPINGNAVASVLPAMKAGVR